MSSRGRFPQPTKSSAMKKILLLLLSLQCSLQNNSLAQQPGSLDNSFGTGGKVHTDLGPGPDTVYGLKVQVDGKIVAAGNKRDGIFSDIVVARYNADGTLDNTFGNNGINSLTIDSTYSVAKAIEMQPSGKIIVAGSSKNGNTRDFILVRYKTNGNLDNSFGTNGIVTTDLNAGSDDYVYAEAIQDGKIIVAGGSDHHLALCRYNGDGSLDTAFDFDGKLTVNSFGEGTCMKLQTDGRIIVAGGDFIVRLLSDGSMDNSFGTNGSVYLPHQVSAIALQLDGKIVLAGGTPGFVVMRLDTTGTYDSSFGSAGIVTTSQNSWSCFRAQRATSIALQADGRILVGGFALCGLLMSWGEFAIARYNMNGSLDNGFGSGGIVETSFYTAWSFSGAISHDGKIILAGTKEISSISDNEWVLMRYHLGPLLDVNTLPETYDNVVISPNPTTDLVSITAAHIENGAWRLEIQDITGRALLHKTIMVTNGSIQDQVSLSSLSAGLYLLRMDNGNKKTMARIVKNK
jgi:uncharacterized delta-60 repeat protein